ITAGLPVTSRGLPRAISRPWWNTTTRLASDMMTSMMCSTITSAIPERWMSRTRSMASCTSRWVRPAIASSSSRTFGSVASARAISSRLRPGVPSERAGASASRLMPTRSSTARALASAAARWGVRRNAPIITFSSTDRVSKVCGTWKVRASPSRARASGGSCVISWPSKKTSPEVDQRSPVRQLKKVDLPAPFGPIRPRISPCSSVTDAVSTALKLPKALVTSRASRSMPGSFRDRRLRRLVADAPDPVDQRQDAARLKPHDQHDDGAVDHEGEAGALAAEQVIGDFLQRHQDRGADQRPEQEAGDAPRPHDSHLHRDQDAEPGFRIDKAEHHRIKRAGDAGQPRAQHEGVELGPARGRAERTRRAFGIPDGTEIESHPAVGHPPGDAERDAKHRQEQVVVRQRRNEREIEHVARHAGATEANASPQIAGIGDDQPAEFGNRDRRHAEIMAGQPQRRDADNGRYRDADDDAGGNSDQRRQSEMGVGAHRRIGAAAEEHHMPDRHLAGIAADDVPGRGRNGIEQHQRAEPLLEWRREPQRIGDHQRQHHRGPQQAPHHVLPIRPCGRNQRKPRNKEYTTMSLYTAPIQYADKDSMTPIRSPATSAPGTLPKPPSDTVTKATMPKVSPTVGTM